MTKNEIIEILTEGFKTRLENSSEGLVYQIYGEYLQKEKELQEIEEGVKTNEV